MPEVKTLKPLRQAPELAPEDRLMAARIEALRESPVSKNSFRRYLDFLGLDEKELKGKKILDIGAGPAVFAMEAQHHGAEVISLDPRAHVRPGSMSLGEMESYEVTFASGKIVAGVAQELPFGDESFDMVVAVQSVPKYLPNMETERILVLQEMIRVLKPGGQARVFPVIKGDKGDEMSVNDRMVDKLKSSGASVEFQTVLVPVNDPVADNISRLIIQK